MAISLVTGNFGASGLRLRKMTPTNGGVFVPGNDEPIVIRGEEIEARGIDNVVKQHVAPMKADGFIIGMAGPVINGIGDMTWLNARVSEAELTTAAEVPSNLCNDMPPVLAAIRQLRALSKIGFAPFDKYPNKSPFFTVVSGNRFNENKGLLFGFAPGSGTGEVTGSISENGTRLHIYPAELSHVPMGVADNDIDVLFFDFLRRRHGYATEEIATRNNCVRDAFDFWKDVACGEISLPSSYKEIPVIRKICELGKPEPWVCDELMSGRVNANKFITDVALRKYDSEQMDKRSVFCEIAQAHVARNIGLALGSHALSLPEAGIWLSGSIVPKIEPVLLDREIEYLGPLTFIKGYLDREGHKFYGVVGQHRVTGVRPELSFDLGLAELYTARNPEFAKSVNYPDNHAVVLF